MVPVFWPRHAPVKIYGTGVAISVSLHRLTNSGKPQVKIVLAFSEHKYVWHSCEYRFFKPCKLYCISNFYLFLKCSISLNNLSISVCRHWPIWVISLMLEAHHLTKVNEQWWCFTTMNKFIRAHMTKRFAHMFFNIWMALNYNYVECWRNMGH